ncbi:putative uncharacterized protein DDB_G0287265 isoform X2 [Condylostylus longicornis]|uniref:putative uncharacterized protein DDB_G0287265 isoform X2 n=1 Tax=Condylostylus longicornis TaxID=2530218 RepID=UPI00244E2A1E|nr:putative uncharacterized protein DDB_G0287265 isoform X2 [Condylostylus longicornis]
MLGVLKKWKTNRRPLLDAVIKTAEDDRDEQQQDVAPPRFIKISDGKISLGPPNISDNNKEKSQCGSPTLEKDLKEQLESMNRTIKSKERRAIQVCRDHKALQARFARQETILNTLQQENKQLQQRVRQYEHCLDDVMGKIVHALVNEDSLKLEVSMLKNRVKDLEAQNAALSASPAKGKDEGYCTMSSGQPQPSNSHLEDLPEEPEQWLLAAEPCSAEMEDWSMSQDELGVITLDDDGNEHEHDWIWNSSYLNSTMIDSQSEEISQLLKETIVYSDDEELTCTDFTRDFYKLVNIPSGSTHSLYSHMDAETDDEDDDDDDDDNENNHYQIENNSNDDDEIIIEMGGQNNNNLNKENNSNSDKKLNIRTTKNKKSGPSPTPSEAGRALVTSCSSSESEGIPIISNTNCYLKECENLNPSYSIDENLLTLNNKTNTSKNKLSIKSEVQSSMIPQSAIKLKEIAIPSTSYSTSNSVWRKSNGWKRIATTSPKKEEQPIKKQPSPMKKSKIPPPVPVRRSYAS